MKTKSTSSRRPRSTGAVPKNFYEYLESVEFTLPETQVAGHRNYLEASEEALKGLGYIIDRSEGISFEGGGHFSPEDMKHIVAAKRAIQVAAVPMALIKTKATRIIRMPR